MVGIACKTGDQLEHELNGLKEVPGPDFKLEKSFRRVPLAVEALGRGFVAGVAAARDNRQGALIGDLLTDFLAVVGFVGGTSKDGLDRLS
jgi:hypothetical protein